MREMLRRIDRDVLRFSGCAQTYYTTDGSAPTASSSAYAGPIAVSASTTLRYFSTDVAGNDEAAKVQTYSLDLLVPTDAVTIAAGSPYTRSPSVSLTLACDDDNGCTRMQFSNDGATWAAPVAYATARTWTMSTGNGEKTVYARFGDLAGNWSPVSSDAIVFDSAAPFTAASPAGGSYGAALSVTLACADGSGSGCVQTYFTTDGSTPTAASSVYAGPIPIGVSTTLKYFSADRAGNGEPVRTQVYALDAAPPTGTVTIAGGTPFTRSPNVVLTRRNLSLLTRNTVASCLSGNLTDRPGAFRPRAQA